jgi:hypothetical protein
MIFLIPFLAAHAIRQHHQNEIDQQRLDIEQKQYALNLQEYNESHAHVTTTKRGILVYQHKAVSRN